MKRRQCIKCHQTGIAKIESPLQMDLMHEDKTITYIPPTRKEVRAKELETIIPQFNDTERYSHIAELLLKKTGTMDDKCVNNNYYYYYSSKKVALRAFQLPLVEDAV